MAAREAISMHILVTSGSGANGNGYGAILGFGPEGDFAGPFTSDPRIADPRGLSVDPSGKLIYVNAHRQTRQALQADLLTGGGATLRS
jgi:hypothetical protein